MEADWYSHFAKESLYVTYIQGNWGGGEILKCKWAIQTYKLRVIATNRKVN